MRSPIRVAIILSTILVTLAHASNVMSVDTTRSGPNRTATVAVKIANDQEFVGFQLDLLIPSTLSYVNGTARLTSRANGHSLALSLISAGRLRIVCYSIELNTFHDSLGSVALLDFTVGNSPGDYPLVLENALIADSAQEDIMSSSVNGLFVLVAPRISINPTSIDFGSVPLLQSAFQNILVSNTGNDTLIIQKMGTNLGEYSLDDSSGTVILPGHEVSRSLTFYASKKGTKPATVTIPNNSSTLPVGIVSVTARAFAVNEIHVGSALGRSGYSVQIPISINNMESLVGFQFRIPLPSTAKYAAGTATLSGRETDHIVVADTVGNTLNVLAYSPTNSAFLQGDGQILAFQLQVAGVGGYYGLAPEDAIISDTSGTNTISASYAGGFEISSPNLNISHSGVNLGGVSSKDTAHCQITISNSGSDTLSVSSFACSNPVFENDFEAPFSLPPSESIPVNFTFHATAEGNQTGRITIRSNDVTKDPSYIDLSASVFWPNELNVKKASGCRNKQGLIELALENMKAIAGVQADISIPSGLTAYKDSIRLTSRKRDHISVCSEISPGVFRIIAYSPTLLSFSGDSGTVIEIPVTGSDSPASFTIGVTNVVLSDTAGKNVTTGFHGEGYDVVNRLPVFVRALADTVLDDDQLLTFSYAGEDADADDLVFGLVRGPSGLNVTTAGVLTWLSHFSGSGIDTVIVSLSDGFTTANSTAIITVSTPVPVQMRSFQASVSGNCVLVRWVAVTEVNCYGYYVQRTKQGVPGWTEVGFVSGAGTASSPHSYHYSDRVTEIGHYLYRVKQVNNDGKTEYYGNTEIEITAPAKFSLKQNYPNPFNPSTTIPYELPQRLHVLLAVYNSLGQKLTELVNEEKEAGYHEVRFDTGGLASGIYLYRIEAGNYIQARKLLVIR